MSPVWHSILIGLAAYLAAGAFFVLRGLGDNGKSAFGFSLTGLVAVAICWMPITVCNLVAAHRTEPSSVLLTRFGIETMPPLVLFIAILIASAAIPSH